MGESNLGKGVLDNDMRAILHVVSKETRDSKKHGFTLDEAVELTRILEEAGCHCDECDGDLLCKLQTAFEDAVIVMED